MKILRQTRRCNDSVACDVRLYAIRYLCFCQPPDNVGSQRFQPGDRVGFYLAKGFLYRRVIVV